MDEAVDYAGEYIADEIAAADSAIECSTSSSGLYRKQLIGSDFRAGCPIVAVAVEAGDPDKAERTPR